MRKLALVIGNGDYPGTLSLKSLANDARAMARKLNALGWTVKRRPNLTGSSLQETIDTFVADISKRGQPTLCCSTTPVTA